MVAGRDLNRFSPATTALGSSLRAALPWPPRIAIYTTEPTIGPPFSFWMQGGISTFLSRNHGAFGAALLGRPRNQRYLDAAI
jgi:hypothetical protein